jgi:tRNA(Met) C34 N-acetyltransferase TmcA
VSSSLPIQWTHSAKLPSISTPRWAKFTFVGIRFLSNFHTNAMTFEGAGLLQILLNTLSSWSSKPTSDVKTLSINKYDDLTENLPSSSLIHLQSSSSAERPNKGKSSKREVRRASSQTKSLRLHLHSHLPTPSQTHIS